MVASSFPILPQNRRLLASPLSEFTHQDEGSVLHIMRAPGFVCIRAEGHYNGSLAQHQLLESDKAVADGPVRFFIDWEALSSYSSEARNALTKWCVVHRSLLLEVHILTSFRIVSMGVAVANLALNGTLQAHDSWSQYVEAFEKAWASQAPGERS